MKVTEQLAMPANLVRLSLNCLVNKKKGVLFE